MKLVRIDNFRLKLLKEGEMITDAHIYASENINLESEAINQLYNTASLPIISSVLCTPDIHIGFGVPIGTVAASETSVIPSAVGYDINCGMSMLVTGIRYDEIIIKDVAHRIHSKIPLGEGKHNIAFKSEELKKILSSGVAGLYDVVSSKSFSKKYSELAYLFEGRSYESFREHIEDGGALFTDPESVPERALERGYNQFATLGGGNHFIELQRVVSIHEPGIAQRWGIFEDELTIMIHSGSRGLGHEIGDTYMKLAVAYCKRKNLIFPNNNLAYLHLSDREGNDYMRAMYAAANFAFVNRHIMTLIIMDVISKASRQTKISLLYDVPHNIAKYEVVDNKRLLVHRKGATRAYPLSKMKNTVFADTGQPVLIPGSMGTKSYLLVGTEESVETLYSVNHGAGRVMSRTAASGIGRRGKRGSSLISDEEFRRSMENIYLICEDRKTIKEEAPSAYKDIDEVIKVVTGAKIAKVVAVMQPLAVLKG
ncbi:MAG: RtcB family protein [Deltaproteobacteria bacterium]|nr:RtcB family protein [Deltaproteobacteria bacterium]